ncbi:hypothetical protein KTO58_10735 [Chitinophaga pendula]|uniref:hypothetical protein n=1 Tax=Chitinophaga TaxID=79328 RepID=UPI001CEC5A3A|nr:MULTISPECIES: hypothetical protein [Chitinophaga]UCJ09639.1 hypothetical protein KTO58_10735 [Chitinophaga pendula]
MKRILATILLFLYLAASTGATMHIHSCMGELVSWQLWHDGAEDKCTHCGMKRSGGQSADCCADTHVPLKLPQEQHSAEGHVELQPAILSLPFVVYADHPVFATYLFPRSAVPQVLLAAGATPLFVRHCTFLI